MNYVLKIVVLLELMNFALITFDLYKNWKKNYNLNSQKRGEVSTVGEIFRKFGKASALFSHVVLSTYIPMW